MPLIAPVYTSESNIVGASYIILSLALLLLCLTFNAVLIADREFKTLQAHRLMLFMGILDCIQLIGHTFGGVATIWKPINYDVPYLCQIMGAATNSAWVGLFPLSVLTAIQRLLIVRNTVQPNAKFSHAMKVSKFNLNYIRNKQQLLILSAIAEIFIRLKCWPQKLYPALNCKHFCHTCV
ncbi:hypothetical protein COOONC_10661 [Cooperia oncophora]